MNKKLLKDLLGWGVGLWFVGYILGFVLFAIAPPSLIGWVIMPIGIFLTIWVLLKKVTASTFQDYLLLGSVWTLIAVFLDYFFIIKLLNPADGYYKLDVYLYYALTFVLPVIVWYVKKSQVDKRD